MMHRTASMKPIRKQSETRSEGTSPKQDATFILISKDNATQRYDWWEDEIYIEELDVKGASHDELHTFFKDHQPSVDNAIGRIANKKVLNDELLADVIFSSDEASQTIKQKYDENILSDVSIGYYINDFVETKKKDEPNHILVTDFTIVELSAVWKGADAGAVKIKQSNSKKDEPDEKRFSFKLYQQKENLRRKV